MKPLFRQPNKVPITGYPRIHTATMGNAFGDGAMFWGGRVNNYYEWFWGDTGCQGRFRSVRGVVAL